MDSLTPEAFSVVRETAKRVGPARNRGLGGLKSLNGGEASLESVIGKTAESRRGLDV